MYIEGFVLNPNDFLNSPDVRTMSAQEVGAYWIMLCESWQQNRQCYLPANEKYLRSICKMTDQQWADSKRILLSKFVHEDGFLYNPRLLSEWRKLETEITAMMGKMSGTKMAQFQNGDLSIFIRFGIKATVKQTLGRVTALRTVKNPESEKISYPLGSNSRNELDNNSATEVTKEESGLAIYITNNNTKDVSSIIVNSNVSNNKKGDKKNSEGEVDITEMLPVELRTTEVLEAWLEFAEMRRNYKRYTGKKNCPITSAIAKRLVKRLILFSNNKPATAANIIHASSDAYWIDVWPEKTNTQQTHTNAVKTINYHEQSGNKL